MSLGTPVPLNRIRLEEIASFEMGQSPDSRYVSDSPIGMPFLQGNAEFGVAHPQPRLWCRQPKKVCQVGDSLISVRAPVGALNRADRTYCIGRGLAGVRFHGAEPRYGAHLLAQFAPHLRRKAQGTTFEAVGKNDLATLEINHFPEAEQARIADVLDTLDEAIRGTELMVSKLTTVKRALTCQLLTSGLDGYGCLRNPQLNQAQFKQGAYGLVPTSWEVEPARKLCEEIIVGIVVRPAQYYQEGGVPMLRSANVRANGVDPSALVYMSAANNQRLAKSQIREGNVLTVRTGSPGGPGTSCVVPAEFDGANCIDIVISRVGPRLLPEYFALWLNSDFGKGQVTKAQIGLAQQHFNVGELQKLLVYVPPIDEQRRIVSVVHELDTLSQIETEALSTLRDLMSGLSSDLLTGRVRTCPQ